MATPAVSRWASVRLPLNTTFPQAPLRSRTAGFPRSGSDLGFPSWVFPGSRRGSSTDIRTPRPRWFTQELVPRFESGFSSAQCPRATLGPPSAQSPFAARRRYRCAGGVARLLVERYFHFIAPTGSCAKPLPSCRLRHRLLAPGLCRLLSAPAAQRSFPTLSLPILPRVSGPLLRLLPRCTCPFLPSGQWPSPS